MSAPGTPAPSHAVRPAGSTPASPVPLLRRLLDRQDAWRATTLNLIASENVLSPAATSVLVSDLHHRYAEGHPGARYYEGTAIVDEIERLAEEACRRLFRCAYADVRAISGTVSNEAAFSRLVPRGATAIAHKVATGGHISHDRMGSLGKRTDRILPWPTLADGFTIDVPAARDLIAAEKPAVVVLGRSLILFPEPVAELSEAARAVGARVIYDGAHVLGLVAAGEFQDPLGEGADVLTGSTHKTFFGPQRGLVLSRSDRRGVPQDARSRRVSRRDQQPSPSHAARAPRRHARDGGLRSRVCEGGHRERARARGCAGEAGSAAGLPGPGFHRESSGRPRRLGMGGRARGRDPAVRRRRRSAT